MLTIIAFELSQNRIAIRLFRPLHLDLYFRLIADLWACDPFSRLPAMSEGGTGLMASGAMALVGRIRGPSRVKENCACFAQNRLPRGSWSPIAAVECCPVRLVA